LTFRGFAAGDAEERGLCRPKSGCDAKNAARVSGLAKSFPGGIPARDYVYNSKRYDEAPGAKSSTPQLFTRSLKTGHDKDITEGSTTCKLDWSKDSTGAEALIEYLKTL
jgi:hypothetical protein